MKVWEIIRVIEEQPVKMETGDDITAIFHTPNGWKYEVFFDGLEPDYLNWIEDPEGDRITFWAEDTVKQTRAVEALAYLAGNLLHLPHVDERLKEALAWFVHGPDY